MVVLQAVPELMASGRELESIYEVEKWTYLLCSLNVVVYDLVDSVELIVLAVHRRVFHNVFPKARIRFLLGF